MFYKKGSVDSETREAMREGPGQVVLNHLTETEGRPAKCRLFAELVMEKDCGIGPHVHAGETEFYYCIAGEGIVVEDGQTYVLTPGDCVSTGNGSEHSIRNEKDETLRIIACVILD